MIGRINQTQQPDPVAESPVYTADHATLRVGLSTTPRNGAPVNDKGDTTMATITTCRQNVREPHEVTDQGKVLAMVETLRSGQQLPPIVVWDDSHGAGANTGGEPALTGSHRLAAYRAARREANDLHSLDDWADAADIDNIPAVYVSDDDMQVVADELGDELGDVLDRNAPNAICETLYRLFAASRPDLAAALEDQRG